MVPDVLGGLLWLARLGLRTTYQGVVSAGHGYADPGFRPSTLPFVSLVGPLNIEVEPERDLPVPSDVLIQLPGHVIGLPRSGEAVTAGMTLSATFDHSATATITLGAGDFSTPVQAATLCADIESGFRTAATPNAFTDPLGEPVADPEHVAELERITCRWDTLLSAVVLSSGRRGYVDRILPSAVTIDGGTAVDALGLGDAAHSEDGRHARQRAPAPKGFAIDVRLDLWASTQRDLGYLIDTLIRTVPIRTRMVTRPALLAEDALAGATELRLLFAGEPTLAISLLHLEATDGFRDRVTGEELTASPGASAESGPPRIRFTGNGTARRVLVTQPSVPDPRRTDPIARQGASVTLGLTIEGGTAGDTGLLVSLEAGANRLLGLEFAIPAAGGRGRPAREPDLLVDLTGTADLALEGGGFARASTTRRIELARLNAGVSVHLTVVAALGAVDIAIDGQAQNLTDPGETPVPPVTAPGSPASGAGLEIVVGNPVGNPVAFALDHLHVITSPLPALDVKLRDTVTAATQFQPGDHLTLGESDNGYLPVGATEGFFVRSVAGDRIQLDRPVSRAWRRGRTLVHSRDCFLHQKYVKRRDDLMNRVYRYCVGYRVSALLEQPETAIAGGLVVEPVVELELRSHPGRVGASAPGSRASDADPMPIPHLKQE